MKTKQLILVALFAAFIAIGAQISIPIGPIPITLQVPMVVLAGCILGPRYGTLSVLVYILLGLIGIPVYAGGSGGFASIVSPSYGFVIGFLALAYFAGLAAYGEMNLVAGSFIISMGIIVLFVCGILYLYFIMNFVADTPVTIIKAVGIAVTPFIIKDFILAIGILMFSRVLVKRGVHA